MRQGLSISKRWTPRAEAIERGEIKSELSFEVLETHRIERFEEKNRKEARQMIVLIPLEQAMPEEAMELQPK